jgi:hypothetical protein
MSEPERQVPIQQRCRPNVLLRIGRLKKKGLAGIFFQEVGQDGEV